MTEVSHPNYTPPSLERSQAELVSALALGFSGFDFPGSVGPIHLSFAPLAEAVRSGAGGPLLGLSGAGHWWQLKLDSWNILNGHPLLNGLNPDELPPPFQLAALDVIFQPLLEALGHFCGSQVIIEPSLQEPAPELPGLSFFLDFKTDFAQETPGRQVTLTVTPRRREALGWLKKKLAGRPPAPKNNFRALRLPLSLVAGTMNLPLARLQDLSLADILLPGHYPARDNRLYMEYPGLDPVALKIEDGRAEVLDHSVPHKETDVNSEKEPPQDDHPSFPLPPLEPELVELPLKFVIGKKKLTLAELEALTPGVVFPLGLDPLGPVAVTCHGQTVAHGRLVNLGGELGVEITRVNSGRDHG